MEEILNLLIWAVMWYFVLKALSALIDFLSVYEMAKQTESQIREKLMDLVRTVRQEKHNDVYYWFDEENDQFLAQGKDSTEIINHLRNRFNHHVFMLENDKILVGPEFMIYDIKDKSAEEVGELIAGTVLNKFLPKQNGTN